MNRPLLLLAFLTVQILSIPVRSQDRLIIHTYTEGSFPTNLQPGASASIEGSALYGYGTLEKRRKLGSTGRVPSLVGSYEIKTFPSPRLVYFISLTPKADTFDLTVGCAIMTHAIQFKPKAYLFSARFENYDLEKLMSEAQTSYYAKEVHYGGSFAKSTHYKQLETGTEIPKALSLVFELDENGNDYFDTKLFEVLSECKEFEISGYGTIQSPGLESLRIGLFGEHHVPESTEPSSSSADASKFKKTIKKIFTKKKKLSPEEADNIAIRQRIEYIKSTLDKYLEFYQDEMPSGNCQIIVADRYPSPNSELARVSYDSVPHEEYKKIVPELGELAEKYTVNVLRSHMSGAVQFLIQIYPNERKEYAQVISNDITWIDAEASGPVDEEVLKAAFKELQTKLSTH